MNQLIDNKIVKYYKNKNENFNSNSKLNYDILKSALSIEGLSADQSPSKLEAQEKFIKMIKSAHIVDDNAKRMNKKSFQLSEKVEKKKTDDSKSNKDYNVKNFTKLYHPIKIENDEHKSLSERLLKLTQLCKKMPMERTPIEVRNIFKILKTFKVLSSQVEDEVLKLLSNIILYESMDYSDLPLFGNKGFYILLSGEVKTQCSPYIRLINEPTDLFFQDKNNTHEYNIISPGECFGTLDEITKENDDCSKCLISKVSGSCEVLLITTSYYRRIREKYETQKHSDKLILLKSQEAFNVWPHQALVRIANILTWVVIPANTLICKEDEISSILGFIQTGSCYVLRKLDVKRTKPNGKVITEIKQVLIGTLTKGHSFGEISLLDKIPMKHSLLTKDEMRVIKTDVDKILELDSDVRSLLRQSCTADFDNISKSKIESIYMEQKVKKDWVHLKECVISEVIESRGIRPGHGKWNVMTNSKNIY